MTISEQPPIQPAVPETPPVAVFPPAPVPVPAPALRANAGLGIVLGLAALVAVGGVSFAVGRVTAPASTIAGGRTGTGTGQGNGGLPGNGGNGGAPGFGRGNGGFGGSLAVTGTVTAVTADHITIKLGSGQSVDIPINGTTTYHQENAGSSSDVQAGKNVLIQLQPRTQGTAGASPAPIASGAPGGGRLPFGTAKDVIVLAP